MSFRTRVVTIPKKVIVLQPIAYTSNTDAFLNSPNSALSQDSCFLPMAESGGDDAKIRTSTASYLWAFQASDTTVGPDKTIITDAATGNNFTALRFETNFVNLIAANTYDGLQRIYFPLYEAHDRQGGYVEFYYLNSAFNAAFVVGGEYIAEFAQNGSVYIGGGVGDDTKLVVRWDGTAGQAGGGGAISDTNRIIYI